MVPSVSLRIDTDGWRSADAIGAPPTHHTHTSQHHPRQPQPRPRRIQPATYNSQHLYRITGSAASLMRFLDLTFSAIASTTTATNVAERGNNQARGVLTARPSTPCYTSTIGKGHVKACTTDPIPIPNISDGRSSSSTCLSSSLGRAASSVCESVAVFATS